MTNITLIDFGATRIKAVSVKYPERVISKTSDLPSPSTINHSVLPDYFEIPAKLYTEAFIKILSEHDPDTVYICSEMHGFVLGSTETYISWKDQRTDIKLLEKYQDDFYHITGMKLRNGLPWVTLTTMDLIKNSSISFYTLIDFILLQAGCKSIKTDLSLASATGLVNIKSKTWDYQLIKSCGLQLQTKFNPLNKNISEPIATLNINNKILNIFGGIGDMQASLLGAGFGSKFNMTVNLGTGSQVSRLIDRVEFKGFEIRHLPDGKVLESCTHIPCGRALNIVADFVNQISGTEVFWNTWKTLTTEQILSSDFEADLNFFKAAWRYTKDSGYLKLREQHLDLLEIIAGIAKTWLSQYCDAINLLDSNQQISDIVLSGGLAHKSPFIISALHNLTERNFFLNSTFTGEETLDGLLFLAENSL